MNYEVFTEHVKKNQAFLNYNNNIFDILEGDLLTQLLAELRKQLSGDSAVQAQLRAAPINILGKIISKLSKLYSKAPTRTTDNSTDQELIDYYTDMGVNHSFYKLNEAFNAYKNSSIELYEDPEERELKFRCVPSHLFLPFSDSIIDPTKMTAYIKLMGSDNGKPVLWVYTNDKFIPLVGDDVRKQDLIDNDGVNPYGVIPFVYANRSDFMLIPKADTDTLAMTLLICVLLTDMNFASMYLSAPVIYGVDIDADNLKMSPNNFWSFKSDINGKSPNLGVLKAEPDLEGQMKNAIDQLQLWLSSRDIRPGSVGSVNAENFSSGISKIISEMDTLENRQAQKVYMLKAEKDFWFKLATIHNFLAQSGRINNRMMFSDPKALVVNVKYAEEELLESRADKVARLKLEKEAGFISVRRAIRELNPDFTDEQIDEVLNEINQEKTYYMEENREETNEEMMNEEMNGDME